MKALMKEVVSWRRWWDFVWGEEDMVGRAGKEGERTSEICQESGWGELVGWGRGSVGKGIGRMGY